MTEADVRWIKNWKPKGVNMKPTKDEDYIYDKNPIIGKLLKLKYKINEAYRALPNGTDVVRSGYDETDTKADKNYVMTLINDIRKHNFKTLSPEDGHCCNGLWRKYE